MSLITNSNPSNIFTLPEVLLNDETVDKAESYGIANALTTLERNLSPSTYASTAIKLMEKLYDNGYDAKAVLFARSHFECLYETLENNTQKVEFTIRTACLLKTESMQLYRNQAVKLLEENTPCPDYCLIKLASLFTRTFEKDEVIKWLKRGNASQEEYKEAAKKFLLESKIDEALEILKPSRKQELTGLDSTELVLVSLKDPALIDNPEFQTLALKTLKKTNDYGSKKIMLNMLCHFKKIEEAYSLANAISMETKEIHLLLQIAPYIKDSSLYPEYLQRVRSLAVSWVVSNLHNNCPSLWAFKAFFSCKHFSVQENLETAALFPDPSYRLDMLYEKVCSLLFSVRDNKTADGLADFIQMLKGFRNFLMEAPSQTGHWNNIFEHFIEVGAYEEAVKTIEEMLRWQEGKNKYWLKSAKIRMGIYLLARGKIEQAKEFLREAWEIIVKAYKIDITKREQNEFGTYAFRSYYDIERSFKANNLPFLNVPILQIIKQNGYFLTFYDIEKQVLLLCEK